MADVRPFQGIRYSHERVKDLSSVITPPYDIISPEEQRAYHQQSPHSIIRLELGEDYPSDSAEDNKYTRAAGTLVTWLEEGILFREPAPAFYIFEHRFTLEGTIKHRWGLTARVQLGDQGNGGARPHESVMEERILDRLKLLRACRVNLSPILAMIDHGQNGFTSLLMKSAKGKPDIGIVDRDEVAHNMWVIRDEQSMAQISDWCAGKDVYIADGHHRYETALAYQREPQMGSSRSTGNESSNFVMMTLVGANDPGLVALPTHRIVKSIKPDLLSGLREKLAQLFIMEEIQPAAASRSEVLRSWLNTLAEHGKRGAIGVYGLSQECLCLLTPRESTHLTKLMPSDRSRQWTNLDVSILHWVILRQILGIDTPQKEIRFLEYTRDGLEAVEGVNSGKYQLAFLMNPIPISSVLAVADTGDRMPPKSTYFYPKLPTGLVMYPLWDDAL